MKTTLDIADPLLRQAREVAARDATTVDALVEQGLRRILSERWTASTFRLRKASFKGRGRTPADIDEQLVRRGHSI